jgi:hypothetical protein
MANMLVALSDEITTPLSTVRAETGQKRRLANVRFGQERTFDDES